MGDARGRISGLTLKPVRNARFAFGHASRSWPKQPAYLLPVQHRLANRLVYAPVPEPVAVALFDERKAGRSKQAQRAKAMPFVEGVLVLPEVDNPNTYAGRMADRLGEWRAAFEAATGCRVLHISIHLDEGHIDEAGQAVYNPHAHAIFDRVLPTGRMWHPDRRELADLQTLTAAALGMQRGQTHTDRGGAPARKHIPHQVYRRMKQAEAPSPVVPALKTQNKALAASLAVAQAETTEAKAGAGRKAAYSHLRGVLKASGLATQSSYQALKLLYDAGAPDVVRWAVASENGELTAADLVAALRQPAPPKPLGRP